MKRKTANIILKVCIAIWILLSVAVLCVILASDTPLRQNMRYFIQVIIFLFFCIWLGAYIWKVLKKS